MGGGLELIDVDEGRIRRRARGRVELIDVASVCTERLRPVPTLVTVTTTSGSAASV
jgi:hypothetical protein